MKRGRASRWLRQPWKRNLAFRTRRAASVWLAPDYTTWPDPSIITADPEWFWDLAARVKPRTDRYPLSRAEVKAKEAS